MFLSDDIESLQQEAHETDEEFTGLYGSVVSQYESVTTKKTGSLYYSSLWAAIAPAGNIYRYVALESEHYKHSLDLWGQLDALATRYKDLLGGDGAPHKARAQALCAALQNTKVSGSPAPGFQISSTGFKPLETFFSTEVFAFWPCIIPLGNVNGFVMMRAMAAMICGIQLLVPFLILTDDLADDSEPLARLKAVFLANGNAGFLLCFGANTRDRLHTLMGGILMELVYLIIHSYVRDQRVNASKTGRLPANRFWYCLGQITNMICCIVTALCVPVRFWAESNSTSIAMDSLTLLFVFMLDDLSGSAAMYLGQTDEGFQRAAVWQKAMLSQCPVYLDDVIDPHAKTVDKLWRIHYDSSGRLQAVGDSGKPSSKCARRLVPLADAKSDMTPIGDSVARGKLEYRFAGESHVLPRWEASVLNGGWQLCHYFMTLAQVVGPLLWMLVNKAC